MKANNEDTSRAKVFIKTRSKQDGTIPDDDTRKLVERMNEKLNEIPESNESDALKEQVFTDLMGPDGHGRERMNEKLNEILELNESDALKEQVFTDLMGPDGHGRVRTFGVGPSPRDIFGARSRSMNIPSSEAIQRMVDSQVEAQLEARVAERVAVQVAEQAAEKVSGYERTQREMIEKMEMMHRLLVLEGLLEPSLQNGTRRSGSSVGKVRTSSNES